MKRLPVAALAALSAILCGYLVLSSQTSSDVASTRTDGKIEATSPSAPVLQQDSRGDDAALLNLQGAVVPDLLKTDTKGHLLKTRGVRDFFDFLLLSEGKASPADMDRLVRDEAGKQVRSPALEECLDLWQRYQLFRRDYAQGNRAQPPKGSKIDGMVYELKHRLELRESLAKRYLPDVREPWFKEDDADDMALLERLLIAADSSLSQKQKQEKLADLQPQTTKFELTPEAAKRVQETERKEQIWRGRYDDYAQRRARIEQTAGLTNEERARQINQLRESSFSSQAERGRAWMFDQIQAENQHPPSNASTPATR